MAPFEIATLRPLLLLQRIVQSPEIPAQGVVVVLSAWDEELGEMEARESHAATIASPELLLCFRDSANTHDEAQAARRWAQRSNDFIVVTSAYHQLRAFLTFVKVFQGTSVRLWNAPAPSGWEKFEGELRKIEEYQAKNHVATYREGLDHLTWRDSYSCAGV